MDEVKYGADLYVHRAQIVSYHSDYVPNLHRLCQCCSGIINTGLRVAKMFITCEGLHNLVASNIRFIYISE